MCPTELSSHLDPGLIFRCPAGTYFCETSTHLLLSLFCNICTPIQVRGMGFNRQCGEVHELQMRCSVSHATILDRWIKNCSFDANNRLLSEYPSFEAVARGTAVIVDFFN